MVDGGILARSVLIYLPNPHGQNQPLLGSFVRSFIVFPVDMTADYSVKTAHNLTDQGILVLSACTVEFH